MHYPVVVHGHCAPAPVRRMQAVLGGVEQPPALVLALIVESQLQGPSRGVEMEVDQLAVRLASAHNDLVILAIEDALQLLSRFLAYHPGQLFPAESELQVVGLLLGHSLFDLLAKLLVSEFNERLKFAMLEDGVSHSKFGISVSLQ